MKRDSQQLPATSCDEAHEPQMESCESDDENSFNEGDYSVSDIDGYEYDDENRDVNDEILDFDDNVDLLSNISSEGGYGDLGLDTDGEDESDDESLLDYTTIAEMELERATSPFDPTMRPNSMSLHQAAIEQAEVDRQVLESKPALEEKDIVFEEDAGEVEGRTTDDEPPSSFHTKKQLVQIPVHQGRIR